MLSSLLFLFWLAELSINLPLVITYIFYVWLVIIFFKSKYTTKQMQFNVEV